MRVRIRFLPAILGVIVAVAGLAVAPAQSAVSPSARAALERALGYEREGDIRAARVEALNAIRADPDWSVPHILQARLAIEMKDGEAALAALEEARTTGADMARLRVLMAHGELLRGEAVRTLELLEAGVDDPSRRAYAARLRGLAYIATDQMDLARAALDEAVALAPDNADNWMAVARFRLANVDPVGAEGAVDEALSLDQDMVDAARLKAALVRDRYGLLASLPWFEHAVALADADIDILSDYAATLGDLGRYRQMLVVVRRANALAPGDPRPYFLQGVMAARAGQYDLARTLLEKTGGRLDGQPSYMLARATVENALGAHASAANWASRLLARKPNNERARGLLADASLALGDADTAWSYAQPLVQDRATSHWELMTAARAFESRGQAGHAYDLLQSASLLPGVTGSPAPDGDVRNRSGMAANIVPDIRAALARGDTQQADALAVSLVRAAPNVAEARILIGDVAMAAGNFDRAIAAYREALNREVDEGAALRLVDALLRSGDRKGGVDVLTAYLTVAPRSVDANRAAAAFYLDARDWANAAATLESLRARLGNRDVVILSQLGRAYLGMGDDDRALEMLLKAYDLQPANAGITSLLGLAIERTGGNRNRARDLIEKATLIEPGNALFAERLSAIQD